MKNEPETPNVSEFTLQQRQKVVNSHSKPTGLEFKLSPKAFYRLNRSLRNILTGLEYTVGLVYNALFPYKPEGSGVKKHSISTILVRLKHSKPTDWFVYSLRFYQRLKTWLYNGKTKGRQ